LRLFARVVRTALFDAAQQPRSSGLSARARRLRRRWGKSAPF